MTLPAETTGRMVRGAATSRVAGSCGYRTSGHDGTPMAAYGAIIETELTLDVCQQAVRVSPG